MSLNTYLSRASESRISRLSTWQVVVLLTLAFWLSSSLLLDLVIMPGMYAAGMMTSPDFATAGYSIFWMFNRVEVLCAAMVLTGMFALREILHPGQVGKWAIALAGVMMAIALTATYWLTPEMGAIGIHLDALESVQVVPAAMTLMHGSYFGLEFLKILLGSVLAIVCFRQFSQNQTVSGA